MITSNEQRHDW